MNHASDLPPPRSGRSQTVVRWVLGVIFLAAGVLKVAQPRDFYSDLLAYEVAVPDLLLRYVAVALPWLEVLCGGALLADVWRETIRPLVAALCLIFVLMLGQAVLRGLDLKCGCFGVATGGWFDLPVVALGRAAVLLLASGWLGLHPPGAAGPGERGARRSAPPE